VVLSSINYKVVLGDCQHRRRHAPHYCRGAKPRVCESGRRGLHDR
jgi:hypothetical protein